MDILFLAVGGMIPILMNILGMFFVRKGGSDTQGAFRYRTYRSTLNTKTWKYAHKVCGKLWLYAGRCFLLVVLSLSLVACQCNEATTGYMLSGVLMVEMLILAGTIFFTEQALKRYIEKYS